MGLEWLIDRRLSGPAAVRRPFENARGEHRREVVHAAVEIAHVLDEQLEQHWRGKNPRPIDGTATALGLARRQVLQAVETISEDLTGIEPSDGEQAAFKAALAVTYVTIDDHLERRLRSPNV